MPLDVADIVRHCKLLKHKQMAILTSKTRAQGASIVTTLPAEVVRRLGIPAGQELEWIEDGMGGFRVVPYTPEMAEALEAHPAVRALLAVAATAPRIPVYDDYLRRFGGDPDAALRAPQ